MIRQMLPSDVAGCMRLKDAAGWNQIEDDWLTVMTVEPEGCWVDERDGQVAGSTTAVTYGQDLAWIGMVLVLPAFRRQGIARGLLEHALDWLAKRDVACIGLDATDMGRPLYASLGFREAGFIARWLRPGRTSDQGAEQPRPVSQLPYALDQRAFGADRRALLEQLQVARPEDALVAPDGYLLSRPGSGRRYLGPFVATSPNTAATLARQVLALHGHEDLVWDILEANEDANALAKEHGFEPSRNLWRMLLERNPGRPWLTKYAWVYGAAGFEYG